VIANLKELYNKQANGFDRGFYKLLAKVDYNYEDINKLISQVSQYDSKRRQTNFYKN
jgi:hypothetical protein